MRRSARVRSVMSSSVATQPPSLIALPTILSDAAVVVVASASWSPAAMPRWRLHGIRRRSMSSDAESLAVGDQVAEGPAGFDHTGDRPNMSM